MRDTRNDRTYFEADGFAVVNEADGWASRA